MTPKQKLFYKSLIKALHTSKRYVAYYKENKEEYKELLAEYFGVSSSKDMLLDDLIIFVDYMNFKRDALIPRRVKSETLCSDAQLKMMRSLWREYARDTSDSALLQFTNRQNKKTYLYLHMMSKYEAQKIIPALKRMK